MLASTDLLVAVLALVVLTDMLIPQLWTLPALRLWATVFGAICVQATPFVLLGALLSALIAAVPYASLRRRLPRRAVLAVPMLGVAGTALPGCECGAVPAAASLIERGVDAGPATAFMVSAPSANPVVLAATATAFPGQPLIVAARFVAAFALATCIGWLTSSGALGRPEAGATHDRHMAGRPRLRSVGAATADEMLRSLALLSTGAAAASAIVVWFPRDLLARVADQPVLSVLALAVLAVLLSICSQADAFIARSFTGFSRTAQLVFMVVGPAVDLKLAAMQIGTFGARFAARLCTTTFFVAVVVASVVSMVML